MAEQTDKKSKRRLKDADSFRERAQKAAEASAKPSKASRVGGKATKPLKPVGRIIKKSPIGFVFRWIAKIFNFITRSYFKNSFKELKLVSWPSWKQSWRLTYAVVAFAVVFGASIALVDLGLDKIFKNILLK